MQASKMIYGDAIVEGPYRYILRRWGKHDDGRTLMWILLNPSTADAQQDDATLRKIISFSFREGFSRLEVVNLYAWRSRHPGELRVAKDPIGPKNNDYIVEAANRANKIIVAWGNNHFGFRDREVLGLLVGQQLWAFGLTQKGQPYHPLYLKNSMPLLSIMSSTKLP